MVVHKEDISFPCFYSNMEPPECMTILHSLAEEGNIQDMHHSCDFPHVISCDTVIIFFVTSDNV